MDRIGWAVLAIGALALLRIRKDQDIPWGGLLYVMTPPDHWPSQFKMIKRNFNDVRVISLFI